MKGTKPSVLFVDDEPLTLQALTDLCDEEFDVFVAERAEQGLQLLDEHEMALIVSDQRMPGIRGSKLLEIVARKHPAVTRILLTGYSDLEAVVEAVNHGKIYHYVTKPWDDDTLLEVLRGAAERHALLAENGRIVAELADTPAGSEQVRELTAKASDADRALLRQDNERLRQVLEHFRNSFWHLQKIQEVLPMCVRCGKVRTGQEMWSPLPEFMRKHAAFLSHGFCPTCEKTELSRLDRPRNGDDALDNTEETRSGQDPEGR